MASFVMRVSTSPWVPLAGGSSILLIPMHQLLLASRCVNKLHFLRWCIYRKKITGNSSLASPQSWVETKNLLAELFMLISFAISLASCVPWSLPTPQMAGGVAGSVSSWEVDAALGEQTALLTRCGSERIQYHVYVTELQNPSSWLCRFETCMYL